MFQTPKVKHAHTAVGTATDKDVDAVGAESDIIYFLVVGNQLRFCRQGRNIPNCTGGVDAGRDDQTG